MSVLFQQKTGYNLKITSSLVILMKLRSQAHHDFVLEDEKSE